MLDLHLLKHELWFKHGLASANSFFQFVCVCVCVCTHMCTPACAYMFIINGAPIPRGLGTKMARLLYLHVMQRDSQQADFVRL